MMRTMDTAAAVPQTATNAWHNAHEPLKLAPNARLRQPESRLSFALSTTRCRSTLALRLTALGLFLCVQLPGRSSASPLNAAYFDDSSSVELELMSYKAENSAAALLADIFALAQESLSNRRLHKRHLKHQQPADNELEWRSSCGDFDGSANDHSPEVVQFHFKALRRSVRNEYATLKTSFNSIDANITEWRLHEHNYRFLPRLQDNAPLTPMCWHRSMQIFIASFAFLGELQREGDLHGRRAESDTYQELRELLLSAKRVLCEIATAISGVYPRNKRHFSFYSGTEMNHLLSFHTKDARAIMSADLRFAKHYYYNYLLAMRRSIAHRLRSIRLVYGCSAQSAPSSAMSDAYFDMSENSVVRSSTEVKTGDSTY